MYRHLQIFPKKWHRKSLCHPDIWIANGSQMVFTTRVCSVQHHTVTHEAQRWVDVPSGWPENMGECEYEWLVLALFFPTASLVNCFTKDGYTVTTINYSL